MATDEGYLPWCIMSKVHLTQTSLQRAMEEAGVWADALRRAEVLREGQRSKPKSRPAALEVEAVATPHLYVLLIPLQQAQPSMALAV